MHHQLLQARKGDILIAPSAITGEEGRYIDCTISCYCLVGSVHEPVVTFLMLVTLLAYDPTIEMNLWRMYCNLHIGHFPNIGHSIFVIFYVYFVCFKK